jgi:hypothetical protein
VNLEESVPALGALSAFSLRRGFASTAIVM